MITDPGEQSAMVVNPAEVLRECLACGVLVLDGEGCLRAISSDAAQMAGLDAASLLGAQADRLPRPLAELIRESITSREPITDRQLAWDMGNGRSFVLQAGAVPYPDRTGTAVVVWMYDLAAAQKLGASIQRLDRLATMGTVSASMAHEIKNALVAINTFLTDLLQRNKDAELAGLVRREFQRVDLIVSQMLKFVGPGKGAFCRLSVHRLLDQSLRLIQPQLENKQIRLRRSLAARQDMVDGDGYQLEQAVMNLLLNAIAAMGFSGQLSVSTENASLPAEEWGAAKDVDGLVIAIGDTGVGIPAENLGRLFDPFFSTKPQGTGLGLAITRRIVLEHRGKITVESELGKGSTFRITLPLWAGRLATD